jgi:two-component system chemotaxis response regulator CheY
MLHDEVSILVVDDVNTMRMQIKELLKSFGFKNITVASNGEEAKQFLEVNSYQIILCDWHMSPTDGMELLKYVRLNRDWKELCFVMVTAEGTKECVVGAIKAGVDDYVVKPLTRSQIESKVYGVLLRKKILS